MGGKGARTRSGENSRAREPSRRLPDAGRENRQQFPVARSRGAVQARLTNQPSCNVVAADRRLTQWSRGDMSDIDGQLVRARERERASQTPTNSGASAFEL